MQAIKQWKYYWYLDFFISKKFIDSKNLFHTYFEKKYDKVLTFNIVHFSNSEIAPPFNYRRPLISPAPQNFKI